MWSRCPREDSVACRVQGRGQLVNVFNWGVEMERNKITVKGNYGANIAPYGRCVSLNAALI
jgi:hypothetical protein